MKINFGAYEVEINAVSSLLPNEEVTLSFLNELSVVFREAAKYNEQTGYYGLANHDLKISDDLFDICKEQGLYEGLDQ